MNSISDHQEKQKKVISLIEQQIAANSLSFSTVSPTASYENDSRLCLTSTHLPHPELISEIQNQFIDPLRKIAPEHYFYSGDSLHMTIKNIRVINDPPHFNEQDKEKAKEVFSKTVPRHQKFSVYFYRLLLFPMNLALIGTTDPELDKLIEDLNKELNAVGLSDDKIYVNSQYFFSNITLVRFTNPISDELRYKIRELTNAILFKPYVVDSVTLLTCNAVFKKRHILDEWNLK